MKRFAACCVLTVASLSCGLPPGFPLPPFWPIDDDTGLVGVSIPKGSLEGTWGAVVEYATVITLPILGKRNAGSQGGRLIKRVWDASANHYKDEFFWCTDEIFEVEGVQTVIAEETLHKLVTVPLESNVDHEKGNYDTSTGIDLWGVRNMPDPENTPLPKRDNYKSPPQSDWMWDEDEDGNPGVTVRLTGAVDADAFIVSRSVFHLEGTVLSVDHVQGLARAHKTHQNTIETTAQLPGAEAQTEPDHHRPKASWFDMVRLNADATCEDVKAAMNDGRLAREQPF